LDHSNRNVVAILRLVCGNSAAAGPSIFAKVVISTRTKQGMKRTVGLLYAPDFGSNAGTRSQRYATRLMWSTPATD
jgi:hypothetical protein